MEFELICLCYNGNIEKIKLILEKGNIDLDFQDQNGSTALMAASMYGHAEVVKLILNYSKEHNNPLDINIQDRDLDTAIIWAARNSRTYIVKLLLEYDNIGCYINPINLNIRGCFGDTVLIKALQFNKIEIVKLLLYYEKNYSEKIVNIINPHIQNMRGLTALKTLHISRYYEDCTFEKLLKDYIYFKDNTDKIISSYNILIFILLKSVYLYKHVYIPNEMILYIQHLYKEICWSFIY